MKTKIIILIITIFIKKKKINNVDHFQSLSYINSPQALLPFKNMLDNRIE